MWIIVICITFPNQCKETYLLFTEQPKTENFYTHINHTAMLNVEAQNETVG